MRLRTHVTRCTIAVAVGVLLFVALATIGFAPASAQSRTHDGTPLPRYYSPEGEQIWGAWAPPPATEQKRALYLEVKPNRRHMRPLRNVRSSGAPCGFHRRNENGGPEATLPFPAASFAGTPEQPSPTESRRAASPARHCASAAGRPNRREVSPALRRSAAATAPL